MDDKPKTLMDLVAERVRAPVYFDRAGSPLTLEEWAAKYNDNEYKRVAQDTIGPLWISTVWLGMNHGYHPKMPPLIFETMVFPRVEGRPREREEWGELMGPWRYETEAGAMADHALIVAKLREAFERPGLTPGDVRALLEDFNPWE